MTSKLQVDIILAVYKPSNKKSPLECHMVPIHNLLHTPPPVKVRLSSSQLIETYYIHWYQKTWELNIVDKWLGTSCAGLGNTTGSKNQFNNSVIHSLRLIFYNLNFYYVLSSIDSFNENNMLNKQNRNHIKTTSFNTTWRPLPLQRKDARMTWWRSQLLNTWALKCASCGTNCTNDVCFFLAEQRRLKLGSLAWKSNKGSL